MTERPFLGRCAPAYDQASQAVHGNTFAEDAANRKLLTDAQDIAAELSFSR